MKGNVRMIDVSFRVSGFLTSISPTGWIQLLHSLGGNVLIYFLYVSLRSSTISYKT